MPKPNALVDHLVDVTPALETRGLASAGLPANYLNVTFAGGRTALLDMSLHRSRVWEEVLQSLRETGQPAYTEIDPNTSLITELLLPIRFTVRALKKVDYGLEVELAVSHAVHSLRSSNPHFEEMRRTLEAAHEQGVPVLVTETLDRYEIIDARPPIGHAQGRG